MAQPEINIKSNISEVSGSFGSLMGLLMGGVRGAIGSVNTAFLTLAANPIGAVLAAVGVVVVAITASLSKLQPVVDEINVRVAQLSAAWSFLVDTVGSYLGIADAPIASFRDTIAAAGDLERATIAAADANIRLIVTSAELRAEQRAAALEAADVTKSTEARIDALERAETATRSLFDAQREQLDEEIRVLEAQQALGSNTREDNEELANLQAARIDLNAMESSQLMAFLTQRTGLQKAAEALAETERLAGEAEVNRVRELRQEREIDLAIAGGATEEEVFALRIERAETEEEVARINHEAEIFRIEELRESERTAAEDKMVLDEMAAQVSMAAAESEADAIRIAENAKREAQEATATAALNALTSLLGDSKGAQIAGLLATNLFEAGKLVVSGARGAAEATIAANAAAIPTFGASLAALPAQLAGITASTTSGLTGIGIATGAGIAGILSTPGASPSSGGAPGSISPSFGPTISTPIMDALQEPTVIRQMQTMMEDMQIEATIQEGPFTSGSRNIAKKEQSRQFLQRPRR